jgi:hypothetical protein
VVPVAAATARKQRAVAATHAALAAAPLFGLIGSRAAAAVPSLGPAGTRRALASAGNNGSASRVDGRRACVVVDSAVAVKLPHDGHACVGGSHNTQWGSCRLRLLFCVLFFFQKSCLLCVCVCVVPGTAWRRRRPTAAACTRGSAASCTRLLPARPRAAPASGAAPAAPRCPRRGRPCCRPPRRLCSGAGASLRIQIMEATQWRSLSSTRMSIPRAREGRPCGRKL